MSKRKYMYWWAYLGKTKTVTTHQNPAHLSIPGFLTGFSRHPGGTQLKLQLISTDE